MNRYVVRSLVIALAVAAGSVSAQEFYNDRGYDYGNDYGHRDSGRYDGRGPAYDMARVLSVDPIVERGQPVNRRVCRNEPASMYVRNDRYAGHDRYGRNDRYAGYDRYGRNDRYDPYDRGYTQRGTSGSNNGALLGAIIGGALGNSVGSGDGRQAATVVGAVIGGAIGNDIGRKRSHRDDRYGYRGQDAGYYGQQVSQRCRVVTDYRSEQRVVGYRVGYEYAGRRYQTVTDYHPGSQIRVRVDVTPQG